MITIHAEKFVDSGAAPLGDEPIARKAWLSVLSKANASDIAALWERVATPDLVDRSQMLRPPETGMVMVRGRSGGAGQAFNLGEMTVTRCAVKIYSGQTGIGYVAGRDKRHAKIAAIVDAMMQSDAHRHCAEDGIIKPLQRAANVRREQISRKAKATQVEFFTMVRDRKA